jgi:oligopeptide/dipeptide ABC transporter ATP-binding protein
MVCAISSIPSTSRATDAREVAISDTSDELRRRNGNVLPSPAGCQRVSGNLLEISNLHVEYPSLEHTVHAVRGCDLSVRKGEVMGLVGESGSGKSMTALACLGLVPPPGRVTGSVRLDGHEVIGASEANNRRLRGSVAAMIFQNPGKALNPFFTIGRQLTDAIATVRGLERSAAQRTAVEALTEVRIADPALAMQKYPHQVSGGQLQRAMIAMALSCKPRLLIADEPTTAIDVTTQAQVLALLRDLQAEHGLTVLFITHDLGVVGSLCDRVAVMYAGRVVESGPVDVLFANPAHPYTASLLRAVPMLGRGRTALTQIPGTVPNMAAPPSGCAFHPRCPVAQPRCSSDDPASRENGSGRTVACHFPLSDSTGIDAARGAVAT